jgi:dienelactone hydrolase
MPLIQPQHPKPKTHRYAGPPRVLLAASVLALALVGLAALAVRGVSVPAPTGPHAVGRTTYRWVDETRPEVMTDDPNDRRGVVVHVWYPAEPVSNAVPAAYLPDYRALRPALTRSREFGALKAWAVGLVHGHALADPPVAAAAGIYPVLIFLPGNHTNAGLYAGLLTDLASHGYIVAAIDHPYDVEAVRLPDGRTAIFPEARWPALAASADAIERYAQFYRQRVDVRASDAVFVLDQLTRLNGGSGQRLSGWLDLTRVGVLGHSVGGVAAPQACQRDRRFLACLNLDGLTGGQPFYPDDYGQGPAQPFLLLTKSAEAPSDETLARWQITRAEWEATTAETDTRVNKLFEMVAAGSYRVTIDGAQHDSFTDGPLLTTAAFGGGRGPARRQLAIERAYVRAFFDHYVRMPGSQAPLTALEGYPEVRFESWGRH